MYIYIYIKQYFDIYQPQYRYQSARRSRRLYVKSVYFFYNNIIEFIFLLFIRCFFLWSLVSGTHYSFPRRRRSFDIIYTDGVFAESPFSLNPQPHHHHHRRLSSRHNVRFMFSAFHGGLVIPPTPRAKHKKEYPSYYHDI